MRIIADGFGGDNAPLAVLEGCAMARAEYGVDITVTGDEETLKKVAAEHNISLEGIEIVHAPDIMSMHDDPVTLLKAKSNTSMAVGMKLLKEGKGDAFVSAGSTGAVVVGGNFIVKRMKGIKRAGLAAVIPTIKGNYLLMDSGANLDCKPETLQYFGIMGSIYMEKVMGIKNPKVGLINCGTEDTKGGDLQKEAYALLQKSPVNFVGNVEAREIPAGEVDVAVADGFTGNVVLKLTEGLASMFSKKIKGMFMEDLIGKISAVMMMKKMKAFKASMDYTEHGGAPLLGTAAPVIKAHGSSNGKAFKNAIRQAKIFVEGDVIGSISAAVAELKAAEKTAEAAE